jgi:hypothetical protein
MLYVRTSAAHKPRSMNIGTNSGKSRAVNEEIKKIDGFIIED